MVVIRGKWTSETLKEAMDVVEKKLALYKGQQVMEHAYELLCGHLNGQTKSKKMGLRGALIE
jgi:hypothetical protein